MMAYAQRCAGPSRTLGFFNPFKRNASSRHRCRLSTRDCQTCRLPLGFDLSFREGKVMKHFIVLVLLFAFAGTARAEQLNITLANKSEHEQAAAALLQKLVDERIPDKWILTTDVVIDEAALPHSHPVLTLHARYFNDRERLMSAFLHEEFHWLEDAYPEKFAIAVAELKKAYPEVPVGFPNGGRDEYSTYIHLIVCSLEFDAMVSQIGEEKAREIFSSYRFYKWIYQKVLNRDPALLAALEKAEITLP